jgi:hypothetical protein
MNNDEAILARRDNKVIIHLRQYSPVWLVSQEILPDEESVRFNVVFEHHLYGWVNRQYYFDGFNDVLYQKGQTRIPGDKATDIQETEPWIAATIADMPNSYGG